MTERFYSEYKRIFAAVESHIVGFADESERELFTQALLNRLMFVHFISRKGWLTHNGKTDYLNALWNDHMSLALRSDFYGTCLIPLFFSRLNNPQSSVLAGDGPPLHAAVRNAPFLRGGLFEENELDQRGGINVPDEAIEPIITELFGRFDFTITESTPDDTEGTVDPELLGMVFEELVNERHDLSGYYTPRAVVSFMCREALKGFLSGERTGLSNEVIAHLVDERSTGSLSVTDACALAKALERVTVIDPACGSGAYLLGMMRELVELRTALSDAGADAQSIYDIKQEIIRRNLYGADLDEFAVNLAKFRLWLALVIEDEGEGAKPLPNLDFKIACGDSLLSMDPQEDNLYLADLARDRGIADLKVKFTEAWTRAERDGLRIEINEAQAEIRNALGGDALSDKAINWRAHFAEVMGDGGFEVVISSPPHLRHQDIEDKPKLVRLYQDAAVARSDLYCYFYARGLQLLRDRGMHVFACSGGWLDVRYGARLQDYLLNTASIEAVYESAVERQLSTARTKTIISIIRKGAEEALHMTRFISLRADFESSVSDEELRREIRMNRAQLVESGISIDEGGHRKYVGDKWGAKYLRAPEVYHHITSQHGGKLMRLGDLATVKSGIAPGVKGFFCLTDEVVERWEIESEFLRPVMTSSQESRSIAVDSTSLPNRLFMCHAEISALVGTGALGYIRWGESQGYHRRSATKSRSPWYGLGEKDNVHLAMSKFADTTARSYFSASGLLFTDNFQIITLGDGESAVSLCAALNSTLFQLMFFTEARANYSEGVRAIQTYEAANLPVVEPSLLDDLDATLFASSDWEVLDPSPERLAIDARVFDALELSKDERDAVYEGVTELVGER